MNRSHSVGSCYSGIETGKPSYHMLTGIRSVR